MSDDMDAKYAIFLSKVAPSNKDMWAYLDLLHRRISELENDVRRLDSKIYGDPYD